MANPGILHSYTKGLVAFEHLPPGRNQTQNRLLFVGGLGDGLFTVPYVRELLCIIGWNIIEVLISSSYKGWGTGNVKRDAEEIAKAVKYFRELNPEGKIVLMGHSTGCQDSMQYLLNLAIGSGPVLDGVILQAPVSDREAIVMSTNKTSYLTSINFCESWIADDKGHEIIPVEMRQMFADTPVSAERCLAAPLDANGNPQGSEDFFSSDLNDETLTTTFGRAPTNIPLMVLYSGNDQFVPGFVDKEKLVEHWRTVRVAAGGTLDGGVVYGANHNLEDVPEEVTQDLVTRVEQFLRSVETL
ncbi:hypothetical protein FN846DRAFT_897017 [Sphaerosporella brunnea]|uniref:DUF1749-domain-containing protein n=1 Tax=Sphaerosporella brunnea TaxID=1250544 RepID=A0A5J5F9U2_9PEZI|nr:hypothetical protein FN846DRAFT_897017 [Sphaerosporella brunnea]